MEVSRTAIDLLFGVTLRTNLMLADECTVEIYLANISVPSFCLFRECAVITSNRDHPAGIIELFCEKVEEARQKLSYVVRIAS